MSKKPTKEEYEVRNALESDLYAFHSRKQREAYLKEKAKHEQTPEFKLNQEARLVLQRRSYLETAQTIPTHKIYEIFYSDTTSLIKKQFEEYVVPTIKSRLNAKISAEVTKQFKLLPKDKVEERIQSIITKLKETEIITTPEDEQEQRELLVKKIKSNIARELPKEGVQKVESKIANEVISGFALNFRAHIELLRDFDLTQNTLDRNSAQNYTRELFKFLKGLTSEYDLIKYFKIEKLKLEGFDNEI